MPTPSIIAEMKGNTLKTFSMHFVNKLTKSFKWQKIIRDGAALDYFDDHVCVFEISVSQQYMTRKDVILTCKQK
jgi:hypothetical protein